MKCLSKICTVAVLLAVAELVHAQSDVFGLAAHVVRVVDDAATGNRWLLVRDAEHPAGPGRLVQVEGGAASRAAGEGNPVARLFAIRAGDDVIAEEQTAVADVRLEAVALVQANAGDALQVRLRIGGRVVIARAISAGRVQLQAEVR